MVLQSQRQRLLGAMVRAVGEKGYEASAVADVLKLAGISRATFYEHFEDKLDCFLAAHDAVVESLLEEVQGICAGTEEWPARVRAGLAAIAGRLASEPALARVALVEIAVAGPPGRRRYRAALQRFTPFLEEGYDHAELSRGLSALTARMAVGSAAAMILDEVVAGRTEGLPKMVDELAFATLVPLLGPEQAAREMKGGKAS